MIEACIGSNGYGVPQIMVRLRHPGPQPEGDYVIAATAPADDIESELLSWGAVWYMAHEAIREMLRTVTGDTTDSSFQLSHFKIPLPESLRKAGQ